jgi:hypothetical protein
MRPLTDANDSVTVSIGGSRLMLPIQCRYEPLEDITAFELAKLLPFFVSGRGVYEYDWNQLGTATRHLKRL